MNKTVLIGRLTRDPELKTTQNQIAVCSFTLAVDRKFKNALGERQADFISCVAWRQQAEFICKYFYKGSRLAIVGNIQTRDYENAEGKKVYVTEIVVDEAEFVDSKKDEGGSSWNPTAEPVQAAPAQPQGSFMPVVDDDTLPFDL